MKPRIRQNLLTVCVTSWLLKNDSDPWIYFIRFWVHYDYSRDLKSPNQRC